MLRPVLIFAFLASLAAALTAFLVTKPKIEEINVALTSTREDLAKTQEAERKASADAKASKAAKEEADKQLASTKEERDGLAVKAGELEAKATKLSADLTKTTAERNDARNELAQWVATGVKPSDINGLKVGKKAAEDERDALSAEKIVFLRKIQTIQSKLDQYINPDKEVALPVGLSGRVVAVDPKWNFVLLDIGANSGLLERGQMKVHRNGKLVAKVRVVSVEATSAIANVIPEWRQPGQEVATGDSVLF